MTSPLSTGTPAGIDQGSAPFPELLPPQNIGTTPEPDQQHHCGQDADFPKLIANEIYDAAERIANAQLEAAVGLAVGYTLLTTALPFTELKITFTPNDLDMFIRAYKVDQTMGEDGSLTISVEARI